MRAYTLPTADVKKCMGQLLREEIFDDFIVRTVDMTLAVHISISGKLENEEGKKYAAWRMLRPVAHDLIKGGAKPKLVKIVFSHPTPTDIHPNAAALFLNLTYENDAITFTTATAQREFALDKSVDAAWDAWVAAYLTGGGGGHTKNAISQ